MKQAEMYCTAGARMADAAVKQGIDRADANIAIARLQQAVLLLNVARRELGDATAPEDR